MFSESLIYRILILLFGVFIGMVITVKHYEDEKNNQKTNTEKDCNNCANNTDFDEVDNGCYMCCKGLENNYVPIE